MSSSSVVRLLRCSVLSIVLALDSCGAVGREEPEPKKARSCKCPEGDYVNCQPPINGSEFEDYCSGDCGEDFYKECPKSVVF